MKITVSPAAQTWFVEELELEPNASIRFFGKYGGATNVHVGFTTGMEVAAPSAAPTLASLQTPTVSFFIDEAEDWFFAGYDLAVDFDAATNEPTYFYTHRD